MLNAYGDCWIMKKEEKNVKQVQKQKKHLTIDDDVVLAKL